MSGDEADSKGGFVSVERERYESLLIELGHLRRTSELLSEYKSALLEKERELKEKERELEEVKEILLEVEWKDYELEQTQKRLRELETELEHLAAYRSWWKRLLGWK
jgi:DNA repair exonuclease SbcCD ATPase subunit